MQRGNLIKQGAVSDLLQNSEQIVIRMNNAEETEQAHLVLLTAKEQGTEWIARTSIEPERDGRASIHVDAPRSRSAELNALLARSNLFAAELRPQEGSLEHVFLELTTPTAAAGAARPGMVALARESPV